MQVLCSTGAFTRSTDPHSYKTILKYGHMLEADGLEVIFYPQWYQDQEHIAHELRSSQIPFPVLHMEKSIGECFSNHQMEAQEQGIVRFEQNCIFAQQLGVRIAVLHLWGMPASDIQLEHNLRPLSRCLDLATQYGLTLTIETIPCLHADPLSNVRRAFEHDPRACVALDTEFLAWHNQLETVFTTSWLWQAGIVHHVHLKDYNSQLISKGKRFYLHPGEGQIDFRRFIQQLRATGFHGTLSLEAQAINHEGKVDIARIQTSLQFIRHLTTERETENIKLIIDDISPNTIPEKIDLEHK